MAEVTAQSQFVNVRTSSLSGHKLYAPEPFHLSSLTFTQSCPREHEIKVCPYLKWERNYIWGIGGMADHGTGGILAE